MPFEYPLERVVDTVVWATSWLDDDGNTHLHPIVTVRAHAYPAHLPVARDAWLLPGATQPMRLALVCSFNGRWTLAEAEAAQATRVGDNRDAWAQAIAWARERDGQPWPPDPGEE